MFQLRRVQCRILTMVQRLESKANRDSHPVPNLWRSQIRHDLSRWTDDISMFSDPEGILDRFTSQPWLLKLANYAIISLFPNPYLAVRSGDARYLVTAACQVLITFRHFRVKEHLSCYTWTAVGPMSTWMSSMACTDVILVGPPIPSWCYRSLLHVGNADPSAARPV